MNSKTALASQKDETHSGAGKANSVREMFAQIAPRYDFLNRALSLGIDRRWRKKAVRHLADVLNKPSARALDLCCGTGDLVCEIALLAECVGLDFCHPMLTIGLKKTASTRFPASLLEGDALSTPFKADQFDAVSIAFGLRNLDNLTGGLQEIYRILKPGGRAAILEFSKPVVPLFRGLFQFYFGFVLPPIGNAVSGSGFAYTYLHSSVQEFPGQEVLATTMRGVGFSPVTYYNLTGGVAALHLGDKP
ncbi:MAG TPA: bifunctional demethylmenaquinone methyltransferase/2-methoxy-6-polyprenyl-1,4-benzoquinol methylase UbiE [Blastocatellia bacterium]